MFLKIILTFLIGLSIALIATTFYTFFHLPSLDELVDVKFQEPMQIFDRNEKLIGLYGEKFRKPIKLSDLPDYVPKAFLASEDARFYNHNGIDFISLTRATFKLISTGRKGQGGSTITMQVARNFYLTRKKTFARKYTELMLAVKMEQNLEKDKILELYLNKIFFGYRAYGIAAAARVYFGVTPDKLTIAQAALLAGLPQRPSLSNPISNPLSALNRRNNYVLPRMHSLGWITKEQMIAAQKEKINAKYHGVSLSSDAGYLSEEVRLRLKNILPSDFVNQGYKVYTTIDGNLQNIANNSLREGLLKYSFSHGLDKEKIEYLEKPIEQYDPLDLDEILDSMSRYGNLIPAVVLTSNRDIANVYYAHSRVDQISYKDITWARIRLENNNFAPRPRNISDLLKPGTIIWGYVNEDSRFVMAQKPPAEGSFVVQNPHTGEVLVMVGGYDYTISKFNRATQTKRQMGSLFKPFLYLTALEQGYTASTLVEDAPLVIYDKSLEGVWRPDNYSGKFEGDMTLRSALIRSRNLVSIKLLRQLGIRKTIDSIKRFGLTTEEEAPRNLSLSLGSGSSNPLQINTMYSTFANGGYKIYPWFIDKIVDNNGAVVYRQSYQASCRECFIVNQDEDTNFIDIDEEGHSFPVPFANKAYNVSLPGLGPLVNKNGQEIIKRTLRENSKENGATNKRVITYNQRIIDPRVVFIIDSILHDVTRRGTAAKIGINIPHEYWAGKTGTTNESKDSWFAGFNQHMVATVWVGKDDFKSLGKNVSGSSVALPIWINFMIATKDMRKKHSLKDINYAYPELQIRAQNEVESTQLEQAGQPDQLEQSQQPQQSQQSQQPQQSQQSNKTNYINQTTIPEWIVKLKVNKKNGALIDPTIIDKLVSGNDYPLIPNIELPLSQTPVEDTMDEYYLLENIITQEKSDAHSDLFR